MSQPRTSTTEDVNSNIPTPMGPPPPPRESEIQGSGSNPSSLQGVSTGKRKEMKARSIVWDHFTKFTNENGDIKAKCHYCGMECPAHPKNNGTSRLRTHMNNCKKHPYSIDARQKQLILGIENTKDGDANLATWKFDQICTRKALAYMIIVDELPFKFVEHVGFKKFMSVAQPHFKIPSRFTVSRDCYQLYLDERSKLKEFFMTNKQRVCLTTDIWTSIQKINYMCLTAHFIDGDWNLHKRILNFCPISSHKGRDIGHAIEKCLIDWGIDRIFTITVDNASSNDVAVNYMRDTANHWGYSIMNGEFLQMRCVAHILNLVVFYGLQDFSASVIRIRAAVRYIRQSPARLKKFKECVMIEKIDCKSLLCLDVPTRWNSTYIMLDVAQKFERAFKRFEIVDPFFVSAHVEKYGVDAFGNEIKGVPINDDWEVCRRLVTILKRFYDLTLFVSGYRYVTSNTFFDELCTLDCLLKNLKESSDLENYLMGDAMMAKYKKYWGDFEKTNVLIYIAAIMDPRFKYEYVCFTLEETYGDELGGNMGKKVKNVMYAMFNSYCYLLAPQSQHGQSSEPNNSSTSSVDTTIGGLNEKERKERMMWYKKHKSVSGLGEKQSELDRFLNEANEDDTDDFSVLHWWRTNTHRFPILSQMARDVLAIPISTVTSESAFSTGGQVLDCFRSSLTPNIVQSLICAQDWLRGSSQPIAIEEDLQDIEKIESDLSKLSIESTVIDV